MGYNSKESGNWHGRAYVSESFITPEQYKMFFGRDEFGIKFDVANQILTANAKGDFDEVVPCDELSADSIVEIMKSILSGNLSGKLQYHGQLLSWQWNPSFTDADGCEMAFSEMPQEALAHILEDMLLYECRSGEWFA